jgi:hypothetical protein
VSSLPLCRSSSVHMAVVGIIVEVIIEVITRVITRVITEVFARTVRCG